ncbi:MAG: AAA family ATPase [Chthonomonadales bacterium]|nr:AAA family ATPase [Chthonomonadales bacterium]
MADKPPVAQKATYTVSEAARLIGIEPHTLRRLEGRGLIPAPLRDGRGRRYTRDDIERIREQYGVRRRKEAYTIAVVNQKGGTGKTTTTVNLAGAMAINGHRVLVIDFDPQVNATSTLGISWRDVECSISDVLGSAPDGLPKRLSEIIVPLPHHPNLFLAPSSIKLAYVEMSLINRPGRDTRLDSAIEPMRREYDIILIDCPPTLGMLSFNAMTAADGILIPIDESLALQGAGQLLATRKECADIGRRRVALLGAVLTRQRTQSASAEVIEELTREMFGSRVLRTKIPERVAIANSTGMGRPLVFTAASEADCFFALAEEMEVLIHASR